MFFMQRRERSIPTSPETTRLVGLSRALSIALVTIVLAAGLTMPAEPAAAVVGSEFKAGKIISDAHFYNGAALTEAEIQAFLVARGSGLATKTFTVASRARSVSDTTGNVRCGAFTGGTGLASSTIIYRAQAACGISAKVILVTLQKEQGLILKAAPSQAALDRAMGMACPDTAPCAVASLGFGNQVYEGSRQLNTYKASRFATQPGQKAIQWHPNAACGSSVITIENYATAALYSYTPYQPNAAALANLGGTGDSCSSYGNRNFWVFYNNWFGSPTAATGPELVAAFYQLQGGATGWLGAATTPIVEVTARGSGYQRAFVGGTIYWTATTGARAVPTSLNALFVAAGGVAGYMGWPTAATVTETVNGGGVRQAFQGGSMYRATGGAARLVRGAILAAYGATTGPASGMGWPVGNATSVTANGITGKVQVFQNGTIYWSAATGARLVRGTTLAKYISTNGPAGALGWPVGNSTGATAKGVTGKFQAFQKGTIYWTPTSHATAVSGSIYLYYLKNYQYRGALGWPTAARKCVTGGTCSQTFQTGTVLWSRTAGARLG
jgi:hypothetical protein